MRHRATRRFWACYSRLPLPIQRHADRCYALLRVDPYHASLHFKPVRPFWSVRVGLHYRALAVRIGDELGWFWIGTHAEYDSLIGR